MKLDGLNQVVPPGDLLKEAWSWAEIISKIKSEVIEEIKNLLYNNLIKKRQNQPF